MTTTQKQHTTLPWQVKVDGRELVIECPARSFPLWGGDGPGHKVAGTGKRIAIVCKFEMTPSEQLDNAQLIVKAVNSHEQLVAALTFYMAICGNTAYQVSRESAQEAYALGQAALRAAGEEA